MGHARNTRDTPVWNFLLRLHYRDCAEMSVARKPGMVRVEFEKDGRITVAQHQPDWLLAAAPK
ncbi:MAG: hypothetical protein NVS9B4_06860 [Candidatus Acidiferrum sp.]